MKIVVVGGGGRIGSRLVTMLTREGHDVLAASRRSGVDAVTGLGLAEALSGASVVDDVSNSPCFEDTAVMNFFITSATTLTVAAKAAGVGHYLALTIVGQDELPGSGYMRAKVAQEKIIAGSGVPYTFVRATQFAEFTDQITDSLVAGDEVHVPDALIQPIPAWKVVSVLTRAAAAQPLNSCVNIGGPQKISFEQMARDSLARRGENKAVVVDRDATYFGTALQQRSLVTPD